MPHHAVRRWLALPAALLLTATPAIADTTVTMGVIDTNMPFNFILSPGEYFTLSAPGAPFDVLQLFNLESGFVVSTFYVEVMPGVFETATGLDETVLSCMIAPGGSCTASDFGPAAIALSESGGLVSGEYTFGPAYDNCFTPENPPADGVECGRDFAFLPRMLFDATFAVPDLQIRYTLTISDAPIGGAIPEPVTWALLIGGLGLTGGALRRRKRAVALA